MSTHSSDALRFLQLAARLLLEYNVRSELLKYHIARAATHLGVDVRTLVVYRDLTLVTADGRNLHAQAPQFRIDVAVSLGTVEVIDDLCADRIALPEATRRLEAIETTAARHTWWSLVLIFGVGAGALAWLLGADRGAIAASGVSSALGLLARRAIAKRETVLFALPFTAALVGAAIGGVVIRAGWTTTPGLCLIVPALMLVPGPHLINGVLDMLENHMLTGVSRLALATGILIAAALGVVLGAWLTLQAAPVATVQSAVVPLALPLDIGLAGLAAAAFGAFYNAPRRVLAISILSGMVGHGARLVAMDRGMNLEIATLLACAVIGVIAHVAAARMRVSFSAVAFAGAVPMMPGIFIYEGLADAMRLSAAGHAADAALAATTVALSLQAALVVVAMVIGLVAGDRAAGLVSGRRRTA